MAKTIPLNLSEEQKKELDNYYKESNNVYFKSRCRAIYLKSNGWKSKDIAQEIGYCCGVIDSWIRIYKKNGISGLLSNKGRMPMDKDVEIEINNIYPIQNNIKAFRSTKEPFKCICCGKEYPHHTKKYFMQYIVSGKYLVSNICKECKRTKRYDVEYSEDRTKLLCHKCFEYKPIDQFYIDSRPDKELTKESQYRIIYRGGRKSYCRDCYKIIERDRYNRRSEDDKLYICIQFRWLGAKDRAKRSNLDFTITKNDLIDMYHKQNGLCAISGIRLTYDMYNGRNNTNISVDRIDPHKGYVLGNIQLVCMCVNQMKNDLSMDELYYICKKILSNRDNYIKNNEDK